MIRDSRDLWVEYLLPTVAYECVSHRAFPTRQKFDVQKFEADAVRVGRGRLAGIMTEDRTGRSSGVVLGRDFGELGADGCQVEGCVGRDFYVCGELAQLENSVDEGGGEVGVPEAFAAVAGAEEGGGFVAHGGI